MRLLITVFVCLLLALSSFAAPIPGTSVTLTPPDGFKSTDRFPGFINEAIGSSIMISEIPGLYKKVTAGFSDSIRLQTQGMKLLSRTITKLDGHTAMMLHVEQAARGELFNKWIMAVDRTDATTLIMATYPSSQANRQAESLKTAILAATVGPISNPTDALAFSAKPEAPFQVAKILGQNMILSPGGQFPMRDENVPFMVLGLSASKNLSVADQKTFAEYRVTQTATVKNINVLENLPITIGDLTGFVTTATGEGKNSATPLAIYQVLLFDTSGYSIIQGITPSNEQQRYIPVFEKIAQSFRMK